MAHEDSNKYDSSFFNITNNNLQSNGTFGIECVMFALDETIEWDKALFSFMHRRCGSNYGHNSKKLMEAHVTAPQCDRPGCFGYICIV
jgi:hypothetical protein